MSALTLAAEIAADLRNRERRFALGYTDHDLTRPQIAAYHRRQAIAARKHAASCLDGSVPIYGIDADPETNAVRYSSVARACDRRAKEYEK